MKLTILNRFEVLSYKPEGSAILIRIGTTQEELLSSIPENHYHNIYHLVFCDLDSLTALMPSNWRLFNLADCLTTYVWVDEAIRDGIEEIVIHCQEGVSRSPALAQNIALYLNSEEMLIKAREHSKIPNQRVLSVGKSCMKRLKLKSEANE